MSKQTLSPSNPFSEGWLQRKLSEGLNLVSPVKRYEDKLESFRSGMSDPMGDSNNSSAQSGVGKDGVAGSDPHCERVADFIHGIVTDASIEVADKRRRVNDALKLLDDGPKNKPQDGKPETADDSGDDMDSKDK